MNFKVYFLLFLIYSICGFLMEITSVYLRTKKIVNRGFLFGPYCSIYGFCSIIMIILLSDIKNIFLLFLLSFLICGILEYWMSFLMEKLFKARWWDYSNRFFNINGRFCIENGIYFGLFGMFLVRVVNPFLGPLVTVFNSNITLYILLIIFIIDNIISIYLAFKLKKITLFKRDDNTNEIIKLREKLLFKKT